MRSHNWWQEAGHVLQMFSGVREGEERIYYEAKFHGTNDLGNQ